MSEFEPAAIEPQTSQNTRANLRVLLNRMIEHPERRESVAEEIDRTFGQEKAVLVLDMSNFSRTTQRQGIVYFLLMIHQLQLVALPCIAQAGGALVKAEADNLFCLFETAPDAVRAAREIMRRLTTVNLILPQERKLYAAVGIGYGRILNVENKDLFGDEMNVACKLGEDIAERGQILLTAAARAALPEDFTAAADEISISGISLPFFIVESESD